MKPERLLDISLAVGPSTPVYPGDPPVGLSTLQTFPESLYHLTGVSLTSHTGTHLDAPAHFIPGGKRLAEFPLDRICGPAWVLDLSQAHSLDAAALANAWPQGEKPERVLLKTSNSGRWGTPEAGAVQQDLLEDGARFLLARGVTLVGIDALSVESGHAGFPVHDLLLGHDVLILEGLDLRGVERGTYELLCLPLKLEAVDGAPVRAALRAMRE